MKYLLSAALGWTLIASQATAQAPPASAEPKSAQDSLAGLLDEGYEIKTASSISSDDQKVLWPNDPVSPFMMVILQKGPSIATCALAMGTLVSVSPKGLANTVACHKR